MAVGLALAASSIVLGAVLSFPVQGQYERAYPLCERGEVHDWDRIDAHVTADDGVDPLQAALYAVAAAMLVVSLVRWRG